ncbi:MAG: acylphosphatase, partial [Deltaproteobacteria bacterium]|nr:acylphosphatase [Deltaproteobacteria bacterium]
MQNNADIKRAIIKLSGRVQGVGFRPFVFRLAKRHSIRGNVLNDLGGVSIDAEGNENDLASFIKSLDLEKPPLAVINTKTLHFKKPAFYSDFKIQESDKKCNRKNAQGNQNLTVSPDIAICDECLKELLNPVNRRYLYPFINCTDCGPRFTIIKGMPYDRVSTVMDKFKMCSVCAGEYKNPLNRRFHAEPNGCFLCGPEVEFILNDNLSGKPLQPLQPLNSLNYANRAQGFKAIKSTVELL